MDELAGELGSVQPGLGDEKLGCGFRAVDSSPSIQAIPAVDMVRGPCRISAYLSGGVQQADAQTPTIAGELFATQDLRSARHTFLTEGHGRATFHGR